jgi:superfamily II DNA or RNA helicase
MIEIIILDNKKCQIICYDEFITKRLRRYLSYRPLGIEYSPSYQNGNWDGITYLLSKTNKFNYGLLTKVKEWLSENGHQYTVEDRRPPKTVSHELDISANLKKHGLVPREHQIRIVNACLGTDRGIVRAATGSGKSNCIAMLTAKINKPTIIYVIGLDLLDQFHKLFSKLFDEPIGYIGDGTCDIQRINIASIWTIGSALKIKDVVDEDCNAEKEVSETQRTKILAMLKYSKLHCFDESHVVTCATINSIYKEIEAEYIYGFSGTPFRDDNSDLLINGILGEQIINVSASELIKLNLLAQPLIKFHTVPKIPVSSAYQTAYKDYIVENDTRNDMITKLSGDLIEKHYTPLVLFKQIKHGEILLDKFQEAGIRCSMLYGNDDLDTRNEIKERLVNKEIDLILASTIFDIGLDLPQLNALVLASGGKSSIRALQRIGRVIRMTPGKKYAAVVDFYDQVRFFKKHSKIRYEIYSAEDGFKIFKSKEMKV